MWFLIVLLYTLIMLIEMIPLVKKNEKSKVTVYLIVIVASLIINICLSLNVEIPSPAVGIKKIVFMVMGR